MNEVNEKTQESPSSEEAGKKTARLDLTVIQKTNASENCNSVDIVSKVVGLEKQAKKTSDNVSKNVEGLNVRLLKSLS